LGLLGWLVGHHASVTLGSFSIIAFGTCCIIKCLLWLLLAIIACVVGVSVLCLCSWCLISLFVEVIVGCGLGRLRNSMANDASRS